jgi:hypothetical protein
MKKLIIILLGIFLLGVGMFFVQNIGCPPHVFKFLVWKFETGLVDNPAKILIFFMLFWFIMIFLYFIPAMVAYKRNSVNKVSILILNLFLGWTFVGWVVALIWATLKAGNKTEV